MGAQGRAAVAVVDAQEGHREFPLAAYLFAIPAPVLLSDVPPAPTVTVVTAPSGPPCVWPFVADTPLPYVVAEAVRCPYRRVTAAVQTRRVRPLVVPATACPPVTVAVVVAVATAPYGVVDDVDPQPHSPRLDAERQYSTSCPLPLARRDRRVRSPCSRLVGRRDER